MHSPAPAETAAPVAAGYGSSVAYQQFPTAWAGAAEPDLETAWFVTFDHGPGQALYLASARFKPGPSDPFLQVLGRTGPSQIYARYKSGTGFNDLHIEYTLTRVNPRDTGRCGMAVGRGGRVVREVADAGVLWKDDQNVVRGRMMALWATLDADNYNYIVRYEFHDDGTIKARMGPTARNFPSTPTMEHTHLAIRRIDLDLAGAGGDSVKVLRHEENLGETPWSNTTEAFNGDTEGTLDFEVTEFTRLQVVDGGTVYDFRPIYRGLARHPEPWLRHDFWVTVAKPGETVFGTTGYLADEETVSDADIVVWQVSPLLHVPRPEDGVFPGARRSGVALAMWTGFDLRPRDLFDVTPFYPGNASQQDPEVAVSFASTSHEVTEGASVTVVVELDGDPERPLDIDLAPSHLGATGQDYSGVPFNVRFEPGVTRYEFAIEAISDDEVEGPESVELGFAALPARVTGTGAKTTVTINDPE